MVTMPHSVDRLKQLLFEPESQALLDLRRELERASMLESEQRAEILRQLQALAQTEASHRLDLAQRIDTLFERTGTEQRLRESVARILDGALRDAEVNRHDQMSRAIAPLVVKTIKVELKNSQDEMVEALYPITGRLVKAYVASAMKDLMDQMNRRIESNAVMLRLRSLTTGRSVAELALADSQRLTVEELFLVRRGSGELIQHWPERRGASDSDIHLSGVLTAINDFANHAFKDGGGNLRSFELDNFSVYLRASPTFLLAAKCQGAAPPGVEALMDAEFLQVIARQQSAARDSLTGTADEQAADIVLAPVATSIDAKLAAHHAEFAGSIPRSNPLKVLGIIALIPLIGWLAWSGYGWYQTTQTRTAAEQVVAGMPGLSGYPLTLGVSAQGRLLDVHGLVPSAEAKTTVMARLREQLPSATILERLAVVAGADSDAAPELARVRRDLSGLGARVQFVAVRRSLEQARRRIGNVADDLGQLEQVSTDAPRRAAAQRARGSATKLAADLDREIAALAALPEGAPLAAYQPRSLTEIRSGLVTAMRDVAILAGGGMATPAPAPAAAGDNIGLAEDVAIAAERLNTLSVASLLAAQIKPPPPQVMPAAPSPRDRLHAFVRANAVFFANGTDFRAPAATQRKLDELAALAREADAVIRVVGYTDETGGQARNVTVAISRAERVAAELATRGLSRNRIITVGRSGNQDLSNDTGSQSANRRVQFEVGFDGELDERQ